MQGCQQQVQATGGQDPGPGGPARVKCGGDASPAWGQHDRVVSGDRLGQPVQPRGPA